jgi:hypothetical protein
LRFQMLRWRSPFPIHTEIFGAVLHSKTEKWRFIRWVLASVRCYIRLINCYQCSGIFVIILDSLENTTRTCEAIQLRTHPLFPNISICRAWRLAASKLLMDPCCLHLSDTGIFFPWDPDPRPSIPMPMVMIGSQWRSNMGHDVESISLPTSLNEDDPGPDDFDLPGRV